MKEMHQDSDRLGTQKMRSSWKRAVERRRSGNRNWGGSSFSNRNRPKLGKSPNEGGGVNYKTEKALRIYPFGGGIDSGGKYSFANFLKSGIEETIEANHAILDEFKIREEAVMYSRSP